MLAQKNADTSITNNERKFILKALGDDQRLDGRRPLDARAAKLEFSLDDQSATVHLGATAVMTVISAQLEAPFPDRPNEGSIRFNVELSPMASPAFEAGRPGEDAIELARLVERALKQSHAVDQEALVVVAGRKVWSLRVDTHVLDHDGNLVDACVLSALAALAAFRRPEVTATMTAEGGPQAGVLQVVVHPPEEREPVPLTIHHMPVAVTFALFEAGALVAVDPTLKEEAAMEGSATIVVNPSREVCAVHKAGGIGISSAQLLRCIRLACQRADEFVGLLKAALKQHDVARVQARVRRHAYGQETAASTAQQPAPAAVAVAKQKLAAELGMDLDPPAPSTSSSDEEAPAAATAAGADTPLAAAKKPVGGAAGKGSTYKKGGAKLSGGLQSMQQQQASKPPNSPPPGKKAKKAGAATAAATGSSGGDTEAPSPLPRKVTAAPKRFDELETIADVIAGAGAPRGGADTGEVPSLAAAAKACKAVKSAKKASKKGS